MLGQRIAQIDQQREEFVKRQYLAEQKIRIGLELIRKYPHMEGKLTHTKLCTMSLEQCCELAAALDWKHRYMQAVVKIQRWWVNRNNRPPNPLKIFSKMLKDLRAALRLQRWWRRQAFKSGAKMIHKIKSQKAAIIQRALRKTILRPTTELIDHVYFCASYFNDMRTDWHTDCQVKIAYHWRKYWRRKQKRLAEEAAKLARKQALAAKKKGKKGKSKAKKKGKAKAKKAATDLLDSTTPTAAAAEADLPNDPEDEEDPEAAEADPEEGEPLRQSIQETQEDVDDGGEASDKPERDDSDAHSGQGGEGRMSPQFEGEPTEAVANVVVEANCG